MNKMRMTIKRNNEEEASRNYGAEESNKWTLKSSKRLNRILDQAEERISEPKAKSFTIIQSENRKKRRIKKELR